MNYIKPYMPLCFYACRDFWSEDYIDISYINELVNLQIGDINPLTGRFVNKPITGYDIIKTANVLYISSKEQLTFLIDEMCFKIKDYFALAPIPAIYIAYVEEPYKYIASTNYIKSQMLSDECERHFIENVESRIIDYVCKDRIGLERK